MGALYTGYLATAKKLGISAGVGNNMFAPEKEITRQEMFTLLYNALKAIGQLPRPHGRAVGGADDQPGTHRQAASEADEQTGGNGQIVSEAGNLPVGDIGKTLSDFSDAGDIAPWAMDAIKLLVEAGIIQGSGNRLSPKDTTTRAQMAQVIYNLLPK